jgi:hypothetical protein
MHVPLVLILGAISCASWERVGLCAAGAKVSGVMERCGSGQHEINSNG